MRWRLWIHAVEHFAVGFVLFDDSDDFIRDGHLGPLVSRMLMGMLGR